MTLSMAVVGNNRAFWNPKQLGGSLVAWFDAKDSSTFTVSGSSISQWDDKSGNGNHATQGTGAQQPTKQTDYVSFDGGDRLLTSISASSLSRCVGAVFMTENTGTGNQIGSIVGPSNSGGLQLRTSDFNGTRNLNWVRIGVEVIATGPTYSRNTQYVGVANLTSSTWRISVSGTASSGSHSSTLTASLTTQIGAQYQSDLLIGRIYELVFASELSTADQQKLEGYLAHRWGRQSALPSNHPYKTGAP